jgi:hypothetical protein
MLRDAAQGMREAATQLIDELSRFHNLGDIQDWGVLEERVRICAQELQCQRALKTSQ